MRPPLLLLLVANQALATPQQGNSIDFSEDRDAEDSRYKTVIQELCKNRPPNEYFRLSTESNCRDVVRCVSNDFIGGHTLAAVRCPTGLLFDLDGQVCDWATKVENCDKLTKPRLAKPNFNTAEPVCQQGFLQCADGECLSKAVFCDKQIDCKDGSDENACGVNEDPNGAPKCDLAQCTLPDCFCSPDGTQIPGNLEITQVPMMITLTFNGAVNVDNIDIYQDIFKEERLNPNGCQAKGTFFVSHKYTNYSAVQELHRKGHEIGVFSITNNERARYWTEGSYDSWLGEMAGARLIVERFANISGGPNPIVGVRAPLLRVGGNTQFEMMYDQGFFYDSSIAAPLSRVPVWPYSLDYRMPHKCHGNAQNCPSRSWQGLWEMPINELDRRDDPSFDERLSGCHLVSSCSNIYDKDQFGRMIRHNFERHYLSNRAPLSLSFDAAWLKTNKGFTQVLVDWMTETLEEHNDVYFLTEFQVSCCHLQPIKTAQFAQSFRTNLQISFSSPQTVRGTKRLFELLPAISIELFELLLSTTGSNQTESLAVLFPNPVLFNLARSKYQRCKPFKYSK